MMEAEQTETPRSRRNSLGGAPTGAPMNPECQRKCEALQKELNETRQELAVANAALLEARREIQELKLAKENRKIAKHAPQNNFSEHQLAELRWATRADGEWVVRASEMGGCVSAAWCSSRITIAGDTWYSEPTDAER